MIAATVGCGRLREQLDVAAAAQAIPALDRVLLSRAASLGLIQAQKNFGPLPVSTTARTSRVSAVARQRAASWSRMTWLRACADSGLLSHTTSTPPSSRVRTVSPDEPGMRGRARS